MTEELMMEIANQKLEIANLKREIYWLRLALKNISMAANGGLESTADLSFEDTKACFFRTEFEETKEN